VRLRALLALVTLIVAFLTPGNSLHAQRSGFPHARHAKLFPNCVGCHEGILTGDASRTLPGSAVCASCHNGRDVKTVSWTGTSTKRPNNLRFSHTVHATKSMARGGLATCTSCHAAEADTTWMHVRHAEAAGCITCHEAPEHLAETATCKTCHSTLVDARGLTPAQITAFPKPASHAQAGFASAHAPRTSADVARCATCHTRESCARCHANATTVPVIAQLGSDKRVAELMRGRAALYPTPTSHTNASWEFEHGLAADKGAQSCANCHTQASCRSCHTGTKGNTAIAQLAAPVAPDGQRVTVGIPPSRKAVHPADFAKSHRSTAASGRLDCLGCHQQAQCTSCHEGSGSRRYHAVNFVGRHASQAFGQDQECSSCHRTETFCRSCHLKSGVSVSGAKSGAVHTGQQAWLLQHGQAARQGLTGCTSCHQQRDCLACHSNLGLHVNPHGPDFDASRMSARNRTMCLNCHVKDPLAK